MTVVSVETLEEQKQTWLRRIKSTTSSKIQNQSVGLKYKICLNDKTMLSHFLKRMHCIRSQMWQKFIGNQESSCILVQ